MIKPVAYRIVRAMVNPNLYHVGRIYHVSTSIGTHIFISKASTW
jgi:hypothetical protein